MENFGQPRSHGIMNGRGKKKDGASPDIMVGETLIFTQRLSYRDFMFGFVGVNWLNSDTH